MASHVDFHDNWYFGRITKEHASKILYEEGGEEGTFLVRESISSPGHLVLSMIIDGKQADILICKYGEDTFYRLLTNDDIVHGLDTLIHHFRSCPIAGRGDVLLRKPCRGEAPPVETRLNGSSSLLHRSVSHGNLKVASELLKSGYKKVDARNSKGQTALHLACINGDVDHVNLLLSADATVDIRDMMDISPLQYACKHNHHSVVRLLIENGANIHARMPLTGDLPLHEAAKNGHLEAIQVLLSLGATAWPRNFRNEMPAFLAKKFGFIDAYKMIVNHRPSLPQVKLFEYFHGKITRKESECRLSSSTLGGNSEGGIFLLRESDRKPSHYVLSLLKDSKTYHYVVHTQDEMYFIDDGPLFLCIETLIDHYRRFLDGLPCCLLHPLPPAEPLPDDVFDKFYTVNHCMEETLENLCTLECQPLLSVSSEENLLSLSSSTDDICTSVGFQSSSTLFEGGTLISMSPDCGAGVSVHSAAELFATGAVPKRSVSEGQSEGLIPFSDADGIMMSVSSDMLTEYDANNNSSSLLPESGQCLQNNFIAETEQPLMRFESNEQISIEGNSECTPAVGRNSYSGDETSNRDVGKELLQDAEDQPDMTQFYSCEVPQLNSSIESGKEQWPKDELDMKNQTVDNSEEGLVLQGAVKSDDVTPLVTDDGSTGAYGKINKCVDNTYGKITRFQGSPRVIESLVSLKPFSDPNPVSVRDAVDVPDQSHICWEEGSSGGRYETKRMGFIDPKDLRVGAEISIGEFGSVYEGMWINHTKEEVVAIKTLHDSNPINRQNFVREAQVMVSLSHSYIICLWGICLGPPLALVQEFAPLGSLLNFLLDHSENVQPDFHFKLWAAQVAEGMSYLERKHFVHRDLAARNLLLCTLTHIKISDFGLSRALGANSDYYASSHGGRWPLKWYAPESINYGIFTHASDVWSFGVTLWEMFTFGDQPYGSHCGSEVIQFLEEGKRLPQPKDCPSGTYKLILRCWHFEAQERPSFRELAIIFKGSPDYYNIRPYFKKKPSEA